MTNKFPEQPKGVEVQHFNDSIKIKFNWFDFYNNWIIIKAILALTIPIAIIFGFILTIIQWYPINNLEEFINTIFMIPFFVGAILYIGYIVQLMRLKTFIIVNDKAIIVRSKPFPIYKFDLSISKLENIFSEVKTEPPENNQEKTTNHYKIYAQISNNTNEEIIETLNRRQMLFIEKTLKDYLNIKDNTQEGEN